MKIKNLLQVLSVAIAGQFFFSCNTAEYYRFAATNSEYQNKAKVKTGEQSPETYTSVAEDMVASSQTETVSTEAEPVLEATAAAPTPVLLEKKALKKAEVPVTEEKLAVTEEKTALKEAAVLAEAKERVANMTKAEKRSFKKEVKQALRNANATSNVLLIILAILIPPLAVGLYEGITTRFWISLLLTLLFVIPGIVYALLVVTDTI